ncbi:MAG: sigma 54-interacting transcriptional regulator [Polyangiaceae bacterium]
MPDELAQETTQVTQASGGNERLQVVVDVEGVFTTLRVPPAGELPIGRASNSAVRIDHLSVSRNHAVITLGPNLRIRDLGSPNGTRVRGHRIEPNVDVEIVAGEAIMLGAAMVMLQRVAPATPSRRVQSHDYFEARVEEECSRRSRHGGTFALVRVNVPQGTPAARVEDALHRALRTHDVAALYAPSQYEILVDGASSVTIVDVVKRLRGHLAETGVEPQTGVACYPGDGATAGALFAFANHAVLPESRLIPSAPPAGEDSEASLMAGVNELVLRVAASTISVLVLGETGVGKEVLAESVHRQSPRSDKPFLRLNCAALSESLLESELFGHERGAFTGAVAQKRGLLESADGGTVFLDEIGELPLSTQVKLLRVIEERTVTRVGGLSSRSLDIRFVAATNRDLEVEVARGTFRQDLFFRVNGVTIVIPPLRERRGEIERLALTFLAAASRHRAHPPRLSAEALQMLEAYSWPGNIRELRNVIERAVLLSDGDEIAPRHLPTEKINAPVMARPAPRVSLPQQQIAAPAVVPPSFEVTGAWPVVPDAAPSSTGLRGELAALERQRILDALERSAWNQTKAARLLGMPRGQLMARLDQYGIARPRKKTEP